MTEEREVMVKVLGSNGFQESFRWWAPTLLGMYVMTVGTYLRRYVITDQIRKGGWMLCHGGTNDDG